MKIAIGSDHGGYELKDQVMIYLQNNGHDVTDCGCKSLDSVDYPDFAEKVCSEVRSGSCDAGILICGTGIGMSIAANRYRDIRAALCHDSFTARMSREHNNANILCIGARVTGSEVALDMVGSWVNTDFAGGRHQLRLDKLS